LIIFDDLFRLSLHGRCICLLDRHELLIPQSRSIIIAQHRAHASVEVKPDITRHCLWARVILSDFEDKSHYYFPNLNVSGKNLVRKQFRHQLDFFNLQTAKKSQLIDRAASRKLRFKLAEMNLIDVCIMKQKK